VGSFETVDAPLGIFMPWRAVVCRRGSSAVGVAPIGDATEITKSIQQ